MERMITAGARTAEHAVGSPRWLRELDNQRCDAGIRLSSAADGDPLDISNLHYVCNLVHPTLYTFQIPSM